MALDRGHSLRVICECLNADGVAVNEKTIAVYIGRMRKRGGQKTTGPSSVTPATDKMPVAPMPTPVQTATPIELNAKKPRDPLANVRERLAKRPGFDYRPELADPKKLI